MKHIALIVTGVLTPFLLIGCSVMAATILQLGRVIQRKHRMEYSLKPVKGASCQNQHHTQSRSPWPRPR